MGMQTTDVSTFDEQFAIHVGQVTVHDKDSGMDQRMWKAKTDGLEEISGSPMDAIMGLFEKLQRTRGDL